MITLKPFGFSSYRKKLEAAERKVEDLNKPMDMVDKIAMAAVKSYPPYGNWRNGEISFTKTRPGAKYRRTGALGRGWKRRRYSTGKMLKLTIWHSHVTSGRYYRYVMGREQSAIHAPWWNTANTWGDILKPEVLKIFRDYMKTVVVVKL
jgi:hypothetical protein